MVTTTTVAICVFLAGCVTEVLTGTNLFTTPYNNRHGTGCGWGTLGALWILVSNNSNKVAEVPRTPSIVRVHDGQVRIGGIQHGHVSIGGVVIDGKDRGGWPASCDKSDGSARRADPSSRVKNMDIHIRGNEVVVDDQRFCVDVYGGVTSGSQSEGEASSSNAVHSQ